jgi:hypothetical protein
MSVSSHKGIVSQPTITATCATGDSQSLLSQSVLRETQPVVLVSERLLVAEAMVLLVRLDNELTEARAQWNQDWFRRMMPVRSKAVARLRRRWEKLYPQPAERNKRAWLDFKNS